MRFKQDGALGSQGQATGEPGMRDIPVTRSIAIPYGALKFRFSRSSGPGGQNVNKVASKVEVLFDPGRLNGVGEDKRAYIIAKLARRLDDRGFLHVIADGSRSQWANREDAVSRLVEILREAIREPTPRHRTAATRASRVRRAFSKVRRSKIKKLRRRISEED